MRISQYHPALYAVSVAGHRLKRRALWYSRTNSMSGSREETVLPVRTTQHQSPLLRKLGDADMRLQYNKVTNLRLAAEQLDGIIIKPGETFSFWKLIGEPTAKRGFLEGMLISNGEVTSGIGGGLCQLANLLYWMFLHTPLTVTERHHHSMDIFPDSGRTIPFGTGATIFFNYVDLQCRNDTDQTFQIKVWLTGEHLKGEIRSDRDLPVRYSVIERDHRFLRRTADGRHFRSNRIFRQVRSAGTGQPLREELLMDNFSLMKYLPPEGEKVHEMP